SPGAALTRARLGSTAWRGGHNRLRGAKGNRHSRSPGQSHFDEEHPGRRQRLRHNNDSCQRRQKNCYPVGTTVLGKVVTATKAGRVKGKAQLTISFQSLILPSGLKVPIYASLGGSDTGKRKGEATIEAEPGKDGEEVAVSGARGAAAGAVIGTLSDRTSIRKGILVGGAAGVAAGLAEALIRRGDDLTLERGTIIEITLDQDLDLS